MPQLPLFKKRQNGNFCKDSNTRLACNFLPPPKPPLKPCVSALIVDIQLAKRQDELIFLRPSEALSSRALMPAFAEQRLGFCQFSLGLEQSAQVVDTGHSARVVVAELGPFSASGEFNRKRNQKVEEIKWVETVLSLVLRKPLISHYLAMWWVLLAFSNDKWFLKH